MSKNFIQLFFFVSTILFGQESSITGTVENDNGLRGVNVKIEELSISTTTDNNGKFSFSNLKANEYTLTFSHIGFITKNVDIKLGENETIEIIVNLDKKIIKLEEAIVVSTKSKNKLKDISTPIEIITSDELAEKNVQTISDILNGKAGVNIIKDGPWATTVNVRGLGKQNLVYIIDGARIETSTNIAAGLSLIDLNDVESIEVVKSGMSALYGSGATGGVINIQTQPTNFNSVFTTSANLVNAYNSVNNGYTSNLSLKSGGDNWALSLNGTFRKADDTNIPNGTLTNSSYQDESFDGKIKYSPFNNVFLNLSYQKYSAFNVGIPGGAPFPETATADYLYAKRDLFNSSIEFQNLFPSMLKLKVGYYHQKISRSVQLKPNAVATVNPVADHFTNGLFLQSDFSFFHNNYFIAGIDYWQREYNGTRTTTNSALNVISVDKPIPNSTFSSLGFYFRDEEKLLDEKLKMSISGRYDFNNIKNDETLNPLYRIVNGNKITDIPKNPLASFEASNVDNKSISGGVGFVYSFNQYFDATLNTGYNFRSPSLEERYQYISLGGLEYLGNPELEPEEGVFFDLGTRVWLNNLIVTINGFSNSFNNLVVDEVLIPDSIYKKQNVGEAHLYGFDSKLEFSIDQNILLFATITYTVGEDLTNNKFLAEIPPFNGTFGIKYSINNICDIKMGARFASDQNRVGVDESSTSGYAVYDVSVITEKLYYGIFSANLVIGCENIFDREYREHLSTYRGIELYEPGRNIFAKLIIDIN